MERHLQWLTAGLAFTSAFCGLQAAGVPSPTSIILTIDGGGWQPITDAMELQSWWSGWSANFALLAALCQIAVVLVPKAIKLQVAIDKEAGLIASQPEQTTSQFDEICAAVTAHLKAKGHLK